MDNKSHYDALESMSAETRQRYQNEKLQITIKQAYDKAPAAKQLFERVGLKPRDILEVHDLEKLPITHKSDIIDQQQTAPPYGGWLTTSPNEIERIFISPGPVYEPLHGSSIKWFARSFWAAGFRPGDIVINTFTYHLSPAGMLFHEAIRDCGATAVAAGTGSSEIIIKAMQDLKVTGFVGTPSYLASIIKKAEDAGLNVNNNMSIKRAWFTGEMLPSELRQTFEKTYGIDTYQSYSVTEPGGCLAYECGEKSGLHMMDDYIVEIVDMVTGKGVKPGESGEIVVTPLHNPGWGLIRFGTGDLSAIKLQECTCACGRTAPKLVGILGRVGMGEAVKVRGMFVVPKQVEACLAALVDVKRFQLVIRRIGSRDELLLRLTVAGKVPIDLAERASTLFQSSCQVKADIVEIVPDNSVPNDVKIISDERKWN